MGSKMKSWTIHVQMGVPKSIGLDVPNLMKDVPNFVKDVPRVRIMAHPCLDGGLESTRLGCTKFNEGYTKFCEGMYQRFQSAFRGGDQPPNTSVWIS